MIERIVIAGLILTIIFAAGQLLRDWARRKSLTAAASVVLPESSTPRVVVFSTSFCDACVTQRSVIESLDPAWRKMVDVEFLDVIKSAPLATRLGIVSVPALVVVNRDGTIADVRHGLVEEDRLRSMVARVA